MKSSKQRLRYLPILIIFFISILVTPAAQAAANPADINNPHDLEIFWDSIIPDQLQKYHVAGAVVTVVKDGRLVFSKGYGYADLAAGKPVLADQTLFRVASISKLFTATAVMQLAEQGKLDLNTDVNTYLKAFQFPATFQQPITLASLLTHTSGLDTTDNGLFMPGVSNLKPLGTFLAGHLPRRLYPPGKVAAYSNYGYAIAGNIVEQVSGLPFNDYVTRNILEPLEMQSTSFDQPMPEALSANLSTGYLYTGDKLVANPFEFFQLGPAGSMSATATDIGHFMIAQLQGGQYAGSRILQPATLQEMQRLHFHANPKLSGTPYGFEEKHLNGLRLLTKGGDSVYFHSMLALIPEKGTGVFVAYNSSSALRPHEQVLQPFLDRFFPSSANFRRQDDSGDSSDLIRARIRGHY